MSVVKGARQIYREEGHISVWPTSRGTWTVLASRRKTSDGYDFRTKQFRQHSLTVEDLPEAVEDSLDWLQSEER